MANHRRLTWKELPQEIKSYYTVADVVHKAVKRGTTLILIHTTDNIRQRWRKTGKTWNRVTDIDA